MTDYEADRDLEETKAKSQNDPMAKEKSSTPRASRCSENPSREHQLCVKWEEPRAMLGALVLVPTDRLLKVAFSHKCHKGSLIKR